MNSKHKTGRANINFYNGDNIEFMKSKPDNHYDLAIVDPPYGIGATKMQMGSAPNRKGKGQYAGTSTNAKLKKNRLNQGSGKLKNRILNNSNCEWDETPPTKEYFDQLFRVSKNQIIWGMNYFDLPPTRGIICWDKCQPWENFSQFELAWTSFDKPAAMVRIFNTGGNNKKTKIHPTEKPIELYDWMLNKYAEKEAQEILNEMNRVIRILDTNGGSGNIGIPCWRLGMNLDLCEINEEYFNSSWKQFDWETKQQILF
jgi:site-specific DNA-methyltransferase (adenine-specific)